jgi:hypothetical protein
VSKQRVWHMRICRACRAAPEENLGSWAHANVWPPDDPQLRAVTFAYIDAPRRVAEKMLRLNGAAAAMRVPYPALAARKARISRMAGCLRTSGGSEFRAVP